MISFYVICLLVVRNFGYTPEMVEKLLKGLLISVKTSSTRVFLLLSPVSLILFNTRKAYNPTKKAIKKRKSQRFKSTKGVSISTPGLRQRMDMANSNLLKKSAVLPPKIGAIPAAKALTKLFAAR